MKLEQAARRAIECIIDGEIGKAELALRDALAEPVRKCDGLLCNDCGEYKQQYKDLPGLTEKDLCVCSLAEQAEQEPVAVVGFDTQSWRNLVDALTKLPDGTKLYAEPVRTKDLTDDEERQVITATVEGVTTSELVMFKAVARAVIAADRELNK